MNEYKELTDLLDVLEGPYGWRANMDALLKADRTRAIRDAQLEVRFSGLSDEGIQKLVSDLQEEQHRREQAATDKSDQEVI
ncbi:hypothetical protein RR21198_4870 [Rhodococcus rhodochrous ATCC 21198]|uniref:hypothetical protein n=1 Tax=Rhodococcus aetherivorans TaxID=191292 RepID=UPI0003E2AFD3|nr:hypothetical protein [Rhodococcus aetherivorans]ETT24274.1 hypothetical protein RR21198_4870 [Rhodococcus rhodochrous ATCC 21198]NGP28019.1 hypothetical protein [Rhodococcus aetherivorans]